MQRFTSVVVSTVALLRAYPKFRRVYKRFYDWKTEEEYKNELATVVLFDGEPVGFQSWVSKIRDPSLWYPNDPKYVESVLTYVVPAARRQGVATRIWNTTRRFVGIKRVYGNPTTYAGDKFLISQNKGL